MPLSEKAFQGQIVELATFYRWEHHHHLNSRGSDAGWPDLALWRPPEFMVVEVKTDRGRITKPQLAVLHALMDCGLEVYLWRPRHWPYIEQRLKISRADASTPPPDTVPSAP